MNLEQILRERIEECDKLIENFILMDFHQAAEEYTLVRSVLIDSLRAAKLDTKDY